MTHFVNKDEKVLQSLKCTLKKKKLDTLKEKFK